MSRLPTTRHVVALTFDGGAGAGGAASVLDTLEESNVTATFFLTGRFVTAFPDVASRITKAGFVVGNHTMTHPHLGLADDATVTAEVTTAAHVIADAGHDPRPWFRFPYGEYDQHLLALVHRLGYGAIGWTVDTLGWEGSVAGSAEDIVARVMQKLQPGEIVLMHLGANPDDHTTLDADALPALIAAIRSAGYSFAALGAQ